MRILFIALLIAAGYIAAAQSPHYEFRGVWIATVENIDCTPLSTLQIRERMLDKMSDTSRIVERLLKKGLADKKVCAADKRLVDVTITALGTQLLERLDRQNHVIDSLTRKLDEQEAKQLNFLLDKLR